MDEMVTSRPVFSQTESEGPASHAQADLLRADKICVSFGGIRALTDVSLHVNQAEVLGLIGANGAGKTTLVNVLSGFIRAQSGAVRLNGLEVTGRSPQALARLGVVRTFQGARLFGRLSVRENVELGALGIGVKRGIARELAVDLLRQYGLEALADRPASLLTAGQRRRLGMARALAAKPKLLLLDEPAAGLAAAERAELVDLVKSVIATVGCGIVLVEHSMAVVMAACDRIHVLERGTTLAVGSPADIRSDPKVQAAYLGEQSAGDEDA